MNKPPLKSIRFNDINVIMPPLLGVGEMQWCMSSFLINVLGQLIVIKVQQLVENKLKNEWNCNGSLKLIPEHFMSQEIYIGKFSNGQEIT